MFFSRIKSYLRFLLVSVFTALLIVSCQSAPNTNNSSETPSTTEVEQPVANQEKQDLDYIVALGLMKGHLIVAKELLDLKKPEQAEPHIGHPVEELYGDIEDQLEQRKVPEFKITLNQLHDLIKTAPNSEQILTKYEGSMKAIDKAMTGVPENKLNSPKFVLKVINGMLDVANEEYTASIANDKIVEAIEYQDSRGFAIYVKTLYDGISQEMSKQDAKSHQTIESTLAELEKAWPSPITPEKPVLSPQKVSELVQTIKQNSKV